jgi:hypothetical protein
MLRVVPLSDDAKLVLEEYYSKLCSNNLKSRLVSRFIRSKEVSAGVSVSSVASEDFIDGVLVCQVNPNYELYAQTLIDTWKLSYEELFKRKGILSSEYVFEVY